MEALTKDILQELMDTKEGPHMSLYMSTHQTRPDNNKDPIRFKNIVGQLEASLRLQHPPEIVEQKLQSFTNLVDDNDFWNHTYLGIAVFGADGYFRTVGLQAPVDDFAIVADTFHTKPLRQYLQSADRYHVLGISRHDMKLYEGNRHALIEVKLPPDIPQTTEEALALETADQNMAVASEGGMEGKVARMQSNQIAVGEELEMDVDKYFRIVANGIYEHYSKPSKFKLILAALTEHHNAFHQVSHNPYLMEKGITANYKALSRDKLAAMAWEIMEPEYLRGIQEVVERFNQAKANDYGTDDIYKASAAAAGSRVDTLLLESGRIIGGKITDYATGELVLADVNNPNVDDLLDDIAEVVVRFGGQVIMVPSEYMPVTSGIAAIFRY
ncbi:MAG TPA: hypothetical protein VF691_15310 [Cytophagaceae bacterium]|jgi:hypothetical protein